MNSFPAPAPLNAAAVLRQFGLRPDKKLGQNFLQDDTALRKIVTAAEILPGESVLEIGPGVGSLTRYLGLIATQVTAIELDKRLFPALEHVIAPYKNVRLIQGDILKIQLEELALTKNFLVVANIPYNITSAILRHLLESSPRPRRVVLTIQREVAERICAEPGAMSLLALSVQVYGQPSIATHIPAGAFYPVPKVDSAVLLVDVLDAPRVPFEHLDTFFKLTKAGFSQKRKILRNSLSTGLGVKPVDAEHLLDTAGIDPQRRAETLSIEEWSNLAKLV